MACDFAKITGAAVLILAAHSTASHAGALQNDRVYHSISAPDEIGKIQRGFQHDLDKLGFSGRIRSCKNVISIHFSVDDFGAICEVEVRGKMQSMVMCENNMLGGVALTTSFVWMDEWVANFTQKNCTGA